LKKPLLLLTRPAEEAARSLAAAREAGFDALSAPLLEIVRLPFEVPETLPQSLLFTSARAPAIVAAAAPKLLTVPAHAVGARTAEEVVAAGFQLASRGDSDGSAILGSMARSGVRQVLHLAGETTAPLDIPPGVALVRAAVYSARRVRALSGRATRALEEGAVFATLLFSARTARHFGALIAAAGLEPARLRIVCLSPAVAEAAGCGWAAVAGAEQPDLAAALVAARRLWQGESHG
jgi:uroporphyrinogen-III synthase